MLFFLALLEHAVHELDDLLNGRHAPQSAHGLEMNGVHHTDVLVQLSFKGIRS